MRQTVILAVFVAAGCLADDTKTKTTVRAVTHESRLNQGSYTYTTPGTSNTNCSGSATTVGNTTNGAANCQTTSTPAQSHQVPVSTLDVRNVVEANGMRYVIVCRASWSGSSCGPLNDGDIFPAEIAGTTMWIEARRGGNQGKKIRTKYKILDIRAVKD
jgi:hypothetical protein